MGQNQFLPDELGRTERPGLITALGVLSFINCGIFMLAYGIGALGMLAFQHMPLDEVITSTHEALDRYQGMLSPEQLEQVDEVLPIVHAGGFLLLMLLLGRTVVRFIGALGMWKGKRSGYITYASAQIIGIFLPLLVLPFKFLGFFGPLMTVALCVLYGTQLKRMS